MNHIISRRSVLLASLSATPVLLPSIAVAEEAIDINGVVTEKDGKPIPGVVVRVDRPGAGSTQSVFPSGEYKLKVSGGAPIGKLSYKHSNYDYAVLNDLSGARPQSISKVMYKPGEQRSVVAVLDTLSAYEHLAVELMLTDDKLRAGVVAEYKKEEWVGRLALLPIPGGQAGKWLGSRKSELLTLYQGLLK